ncbi:MAG: DUF1579 family protein [Planctomycetes bacterium]|nr:DUF1579 family protein [Planctomycetota bacterium]
MHALALTATLSAAAFVAGALWMQDSAPKRFTHPISKDADGGMARWMETMKPGPAHQRLAELIGTYDLTMRMQMAPGQPPMESKGTLEISWLAEGKWRQTRGEISMLGQKSMLASSIGYDNFKQRYVWAKVDGLQTELATAMGHFDKSGDNLILWGTIDEPMTPEQDKMVKYVWRGYGQDTFVLEVHDMMIGEENTRVLEIEHRRRK